MKTRSLLFSAFIAMMGFVACEALDPNQTQAPVGEPKKFTVHIGMTGEVDVSYQPLTRFTPDEQDLYGIQVWHKPASKGSYEPFAYGLFDNLENATLVLTENYDYKFKVILVDDAKDKIFCDSILVDSNNYLGYAEPFKAYNNYNGTTANSKTITKITNEFIVSETCYFERGDAYFDTFTYRLKDGKIYSNPSKLDVYYGEVAHYIPSEEGSQISIYLKRMNYGLKIIAGDFFDNGIISVRVGDYDDYYTLTPQNKEVEDTFAYNMVDNWYNDSNTASAQTTTMNVDFTWTKEDGTIVNWARKSYTFYRLKQTIINLDYYSDDESYTNSLVFHYEDLPIEDVYQEYTHGSNQEDYDW